MEDYEERLNNTTLHDAEHNLPGLMIKICRHHSLIPQKSNTLIIENDEKNSILMRSIVIQ